VRRGPQLFKPYERLGPVWTDVEDVIITHRILFYVSFILSVLLASPDLFRIALCTPTLLPYRALCPLPSFAARYSVLASESVR
jgi:hypothetical protein